MTDTNNNTPLLDAYGFNEMSDDEKLILVNDIGSLIMESATLRFMTESDEDTGENFSRVVETYADKDNLPQVLTETFPAFGVILDEEAEAFRKDAEAVLLGRGEEK